MVRCGLASVAGSEPAAASLSQRRCCPLASGASRRRRRGPPACGGRGALVALTLAAGASTLVVAESSTTSAEAAAREAAFSPLESRLAGALWGLFAGDALAMPVHWYYGGPAQIRQNYGGKLLAGYERAVHPFPESIMQLSSTGGGGRGDDDGDVIGGIILHDKKSYWARGGQYHYHHTLQPGENTLEASLARLLMQTVVEAGGQPTADGFRQAYVRFMVTPGSHNDTYASTCHRMFFKKWRTGVEPADCPDNDGHNVDTMDGLVLPAVAALAVLGSGGSGADRRAAARAAALDTLAVTRRSAELPLYVEALVDMLADVVVDGKPLRDAAEALSQQRYGGEPGNLGREVARRGSGDPMVACYIGGAFPALLHFAYKYADVSVREALLASANAGGENVHRGAVLGALIGGAAGLKGFDAPLREGLFSHDELRDEIFSFLDALALLRRQAGRDEI